MLENDGSRNGVRRGSNNVYYIFCFLYVGARLNEPLLLEGTGGRCIFCMKGKTGFLEGERGQGENYA